MRVDVVVSRYNEDISWVKDLPYSYNIIIYDKSEEPLKHAISRPNIGREAETWLYHIINNYNNLADVTLFLQGYPFDHFQHKTFDGIHSLVNYLNSIEGVLSKPISEQQGAYNLPVRQYFNWLFDKDHSQNFVFVPGAQYAIKKEVILSRDIQFYKKLHQMISNNPYTSFEKIIASPTYIDPWTIERLWLYIFT